MTMEGLSIGTGLAFIGAGIPLGLAAYAACFALCEMEEKVSFAQIMAIIGAVELPVLLVVGLVFTS